MSEKDFFTQELKVKNVHEHSWQYCVNLCKGKKVLHVGCSDWPLTDPKNSLHRELQQHCSILHGVDDKDTDKMGKVLGGSYYKNLSDVKEGYDVIIVPNVLEHVSNAGIFMNTLLNIGFKELFILVPNYSISHEAKYLEDGTFIEKVHPDHVAWYSPYTLSNLVRRYWYSTDIIEQTMFFDGTNMVGILITRG